MSISNNQETNHQTFSTYIKKNLISKNIQTTLGNVGKSQRFVASLISAVANNKSLSNCDYSTIIGAALLGETLNLSPSPQLGHYFIVPYKGKATFQLGYKGYIQLAIRSGQYRRINVLSIKKGELVKYDPLNEEIEVNLISDELKREAAETIGYYAMFELTNSFRKSLYWTKNKMEAHAKKYSQAYSAKNNEYSFWTINFDEMAYKTLLRQLISKWGIMSIDLQNAFVNDMAFQDEQGNQKYLDNPNESLHEIIEQPEPSEEVEVIKLGDIT